MDRRVETRLLPGECGGLEARLDWPAGPRRGAALVCHAHPLHGGSMHTKAVSRAARGLVAAGFVTLRFNFRGVGASAGQWSGGPGEMEDARVAMAHLVGLRQHGTLVLGGFSFGAAIALRLGVEAASTHGVGALCGIAPPLDRFDFRFLAATPCPVLLVAGDADPFCPLADLEALRRDIGAPARVAVLPGAGHLLVERLDALERTVRDFALAVGIAAPGPP